MIHLTRRRFVALSGNSGFCPHCNELLKAFEILDSNMSNEEAFSYSVVQDMRADDPADIEILTLTKGASPAVVTENMDVYVGSGDYEMLKDYFAIILGVRIWRL